MILSATTHPQIAKRFSIATKTVQRCEAKGRAVGKPPPWDRPDALAEWYGANYSEAAELPAWIVNALSAPAASPASRPRVPRKTAGENIGAAESHTGDGDDGMEYSQLQLLERLERVERQHLAEAAEPGAEVGPLLTRMRSYSGILRQIRQLHEKAVQDEGEWLPKKRVLELIDSIHMRIPRRIESELTAARQAAVDAAVDPARWSEFAKEWTAGVCRRMVESRVGANAA